MNIGVRGGYSYRNARELAEIKETAHSASVMPIRIVGLTGGIASGKTAATTALRDAGFTVIDADEVSRTLTARGSSAETELIKMFPDAADGDALDRLKLRKIISSDAEARKRLNAYTHPLITAEIERLISESERAVLSAPLLFESALSSLCDCIVCIVCPRRTRVQRLVSRDGVTEAEAERMIGMQLPDSIRAPLADFCVPSDVPETEFKREVVELFTEIFYN